MPNNDAYHRLLQNLAASSGMGELTFDADGQCNLYVNDTIPLALKRSDDGQTLTVLCSLEQGLPPDIGPQWARRVLEIALNPARNAPGVGFAPASDSLIFYRTLPLTVLEGDTLQDVIAELLDMREQWPQLVTPPSAPPTPFAQNIWIKGA